MKKLYVSDLDGTLLDSNAVLSEKTAEILNNLIDNGMNFTFATARSAASALEIMAGLKLEMPCILMNGVSIYDTKKDTYIKNEYIQFEDAVLVADAFESHNLYPFMYKIEEDVLFALYTQFSNDTMEEYYRIRHDKYKKPFDRCDDFREHAKTGVVYFTLCDSFEKLLPVKEEIEKISDVKFEFYKDVYHKEYWFLEIFSRNASKYNAVKFLREYGGFDHVTAFGDNLNDIPLFEASDRKIAVQNAKDELKNLADCIIGDNNSDAVALWLNKTYNSERI